LKGPLYEQGEARLIVEGREDEQLMREDYIRTRGAKRGFNAVGEGKGLSMQSGRGGRE